jgi:hypothetical protein
MQVASGPVREGLPTSAFTVTLVVALALGGFLLARVIRPPVDGTFSVGNAIGTACPVGGGAPACFQVNVTNTSDEPAPVRCDVTPAEGTTAQFLAGNSVYRSDVPLVPGEPIGLVVKVGTTGTTVLPPSVACARAG